MPLLQQPAASLIFFRLHDFCYNVTKSSPLLQFPSLVTHKEKFSYRRIASDLRAFVMSLSTVALCSFRAKDLSDPLYFHFLVEVRVPTYGARSVKLVTFWILLAAAYAQCHRGTEARS